MSNNPIWITVGTAHTLDEIASFLEKNGPQKYGGLSEAFPAMKRNRITRMLSILENWGVVYCDRKRRKWGISSPGWRRKVEDRVMPDIPLTGSARKFAVQRIQYNVMRAARECGDESCTDPATEIGYAAADYFADASIRHGRVVRHPCGSLIRNFVPTAGSIDDIIAALASQSSRGTSGMTDGHA